ncbi:MAG: helix-turn-helix transcriptional regulator [Cytophagaceae bacterium]|nr:helix-turn-helix transcriptional regulator [Cytophagaceae bacterium]
MAELSGMGVTNFTEKLKNNLGFSPFDYLIFLRINEAARLLKESDFNLPNRI